MTEQKADYETSKPAYIPTPADKALLASLQVTELTGAIQQAHIDGQIDRATYDKLFSLARRAGNQIADLEADLERGQSHA
jgi:hypothetical protein